MRLRLIIWLCSMMGVISLGSAQDLFFSQYYNAPSLLNPAFTGATPEHRVILNHRNQWPSLPQSFVTYMLSYDYYASKYNSGFGLNVFTDKAGSADFRSTTVSFSYAYKINMDNWVLSPGLSIGYTMRNINFNKLILGDQLEFGSQNLPPTIDPTVFETENYFDVATGIVAYNDKMWIGGAIFHINQPNTSVANDVDELPYRLTIHGGYRIKLYNGPFKKERISSLAPSFVYKKQGNFDQLDIGAHFYYEPIVLGLWYRGIPIQQDVEDLISQDALVFLLGFKLQGFEVNYSYDMTISNLGSSSGGAHEISLILQFLSPRFRDISKRRKPIPCPAFMDQSLFQN